MGWPLRGGSSFREFGGSFIYPMGEERVALGMVIGLDYTDATLSVHDLLQELKSHSFVRPILEGGTRVAWGAKTIPEGGLLALPDRLHFPGGMIVGDGAGLVNVPALKGIHYAMRSGMLAAETALDAVRPGQTAWTPGALEGYDRALREDYVWKDLERVATCAPPSPRASSAGRSRAGSRSTRSASLPRKDRPLEADADVPVVVGNRSARYPAPDGELTFDSLSSVYLSGNKTRDDAPSHIRVRRTVAREVAEAWVHMCPHRCTRSAGVEDGQATVDLTPSNCVQCGAISAKGGRLTPARGWLRPRVLGHVSTSLDAPPVTPDDVLRASRAVANRLHRTPIFSSATLSGTTGAHAFLKAELFQRTGSFKPRGLLARLASLSPEERRRGVITVSAGNAAAALAYGAALEGIDCLVVHVERGEPLKIEATRGYGATVDLEASSPADAFARAEEVAERDGRTSSTRSTTPT